jgi:16S rRNA (cytosine1402-N4)-methyltransferase
MHIPVLLHEVLESLDPKPGEFFVDGTFGGGGYTKALLERVGPTGTVLALDWDSQAIERGKVLAEQYPNLILRAANYTEVPGILREKELGKPDGIVLDLGFSSEQLTGSGRGFSFSPDAVDEPLLMTYSDAMTPVRELIRGESEEDLRSIIRKYGEERFAGRIARALKTASRKGSIETAGELAEIIRRAVPGSYERGRREAGRNIDPATRTFQALRIYANRELENLEQFLVELPGVLEGGGRIGIVSFHSLEDRIVKLHFKSLVHEGLMELIHKKPLTATREEIHTNPRARSAKLRAGIFLNEKLKSQK